MKLNLKITIDSLQTKNKDQFYADLSDVKIGTISSTHLTANQTKKNSNDIDYFPGRPAARTKYNQ